jgi:hypothetical protein
VVITSRPPYPQERAPLPFEQEAGWALLDGCGKYSVGYQGVKCRGAKLISAISQKNGILSYTAAKTSETDIWHCLLCVSVRSADEARFVTRIGVTRVETLAYRTSVPF